MKISLRRGSLVFSPAFPFVRVQAVRLSSLSCDIRTASISEMGLRSVKSFQNLRLGVCLLSVHFSPTNFFPHHLILSYVFFKPLHLMSDFMFFYIAAFSPFFVDIFHPFSLFCYFRSFCTFCGLSSSFISFLLISFCFPVTLSLSV